MVRSAVFSFHGARCGRESLYHSPRNSAAASRTARMTLSARAELQIRARRTRRAYWTESRLDQGERDYIGVDRAAEPTFRAADALFLKQGGTSSAANGCWDRDQFPVGRRAGKLWPHSFFTRFPWEAGRQNGWIAAEAACRAVYCGAGRKRGMMRLSSDNSCLITPTGANQSRECDDARARLPATS
jgi:hypothetical protein